MFSACGPDRRSRERASSRSTSPAFRSRKCRSARGGRRARRRTAPRNESCVIGPPAEPGDDGVQLGRRSRAAPARTSVAPRCRRRRARTPSRARPPAGAPASAVAHLVERERAGTHVSASAPIADARRRAARRPPPRSCRAPSRARRRSSPRRRSGRAGRARRTRGRTPCAKSAAICGITSRAWSCLACIRYLDLGERLRPDHRADRHRLGRIEQLARLERRQERVDLLLVGHVDLLDGVGEDEAVHAHHHRQPTAPRPAGTPGRAGRAASWLVRRTAGSSRSRAGTSRRCGRSRC